MSPERQAYLSAIERTFVTLRGRGFMLSPKEVALVDRWFEAEVPARVVIRTLQDGFARRSQRRQPPPSTLTYFESQIEVAIDDWHRKHTGAPTTSSIEEETPGTQVSAAFDVLIAASSSPQVEALLNRLRSEIEPVDDDVDVYALTTDLDERIVAGLSDLLGDEERSKMAQASRQAGMSASSMSARARARLEAAELARATRAHFQIPSLSESLA
ncbi:MAG: hypothetical protein CL940_09625 [Deltaproteobacteria bacterium]|nr:hypothetical protein [Deltaproteobacteria bacterium]